MICIRLMYFASIYMYCWLAWILYILLTISVRVFCISKNDEIPFCIGWLFLLPIFLIAKVHFPYTRVRGFVGTSFVSKVILFIIHIFFTCSLPPSNLHVINYGCSTFYWIIVSPPYEEILVWWRQVGNLLSNSTRGKIKTIYRLYFDIHEVSHSNLMILEAACINKMERATYNFSFSMHDYSVN